MSTQKFFYRWIILAASFFLMAVPFSIVNTIHTLFITPVTEKMGFTMSAFSLIFTFSAIVIAVMSPVVGSLINHLSIRLMMSIGAFFVGMGFICYSFATSIYTFYAISLVVAVGMVALTTIPIATMLTNWFQEQRGTALGIAFAGAGTGTFFWMQIVSDTMQEYGYPYSYLMLGVIILAVALPITLFLVVKSPGDRYQIEQNAAQKEQSEKTVGKSNVGTIMKNPSFWPFSIGLFLMGIAVSGVQIHLQPYLMSLGYALSYNANIGSTLAMSALIGNMVGGVVFDKFPTKTALTFFCVGILIGLLALLVAEHDFVPYCFAVIFGASLCLASLWPPFGVGKIFPGESYSATLGIVNLFFIAGGGLGPFFSGLMADSAFGYKAAWVIYFILTCFYLFLFRKSLRV